MSNKIFKLADANQTVQYWKNQGFNVVFTNGCFDILHRGHIDNLSLSASFGDRLVVGLNSDQSVRRLKGDSRPINDEVSRAILLQALEMVDLVIVFDEDTPLETIKVLMPDVLTKGGDYSIDEIVGANEVIEAGGTVEIIPLTPNLSSSELITKILKL